MRRTRAIVFPLCAAMACASGEVSPAADDHGEAAAHAHEQPHAEVPRSVHLTDEVVEQAGIETAPAQTRTLARTVRLPGEVVADPDRRARVGARVQGIVEKLRVRPGDAVEAGDILATIRAPNLQSLRAAEAALRARATSARANAQRVGQLVDKRMASQQEAVAARAEADALEAETRAARERLRALGVRRSRGGAVSFDVRSPMTGVVIERELVAGDPVTAETVIATVVSTDQVWFVGHVFERDVASVRPGAAAAVRLNAHPDAVFRGTVEYVSHQVDPGARTLSARIPLPNPDGRLRLGLFGTAHVVVGNGEAKPVLTVQNSAVTRMLDESVVFVRQPDGGFEVHDVVLGESDTEYTEVVHGLREGEQVVMTGAFTIKSALLRSTLGEDGH